MIRDITPRMPKKCDDVFEVARKLCWFAMKSYDLTAPSIADAECIRFEFMEASGLIAWNKSTAVLAFTGSNDDTDWRRNRTDGRIALGHNAHCHRHANIEVHEGFYEYAMHSLVAIRERHLDDFFESKTIYYTGHSLGGTTAGLMNLMMAGNGTAITFGAPPFVKKSPDSWRYPPNRLVRFERVMDPVPMMLGLTCTHVGSVRYIVDGNQMIAWPPMRYRLPRLATSLRDWLMGYPVHDVKQYHDDLDALIHVPVNVCHKSA